MAASEDLWPEFEPSEIISPKTILAEQAAFLKEKTKNILNVDLYEMNSSTSDYPFTVDFDVTAPLLKNYRFTLFSLAYRIINYPCLLLWEGKNYVVKDEAALIDMLKTVFNDANTRKIISNLLGQSMSIKK